MFRQERTVGVEEIGGLRKHVQEEEARKKLESVEEEAKVPPPGSEGPKSTAEEGKEDTKMEVDEPATAGVPVDKQGESTPPATQSNPDDPDKKDTSDSMQADEDDAVEY